jgi:hypothetical protein
MSTTATTTSPLLASSSTTRLYDSIESDSELESSSSSSEQPQPTTLDDLMKVFLAMQNDTRHQFSEMRNEFSEMRNDTRHQFSEMRNELSEMRNDTRQQFSEVRNELSKLRDDLGDVRAKLDRVELHTSAQVEAAYRQSRNCVAMYVRTIDDAINLLYTGKSFDSLQFNKKAHALADHLYRNSTRKLFKLICPDVQIDDRANAELWETQAFTPLKGWMMEQDEKAANQTQSSPDDVESSSLTARKTVVTSFIKLLQPFQNKTTAKKEQLHSNGIEFLRNDRTGLALSLILADRYDKLVAINNAHQWSWLLLDIDGFKGEVCEKKQIYTITEIKMGEGFKTAKKQLLLRAQFVDIVASITKYDEQKLQVRLVAALLTRPDKPGDDSFVEVSPEEQNYTAIRVNGLDKSYFQL